MVIEEEVDISGEVYKAGREFQILVVDLVNRVELIEKSRIQGKKLLIEKRYSEMEWKLEYLKKIEVKYSIFTQFIWKIYILSRSKNSKK